MISTYLLSLTSISQWGLFLGIVFIIYGWLEKNEKFILAGHLTFLLIGFMAWWIILTDQIVVTESPDQIISKHAKILAFFKGLAGFSLLNIVTLLVKIFKLRYQQIGIIILIIFALMLFFMVYSVLHMAS